MRDRIERRKKIRKIGALVVLGIFVATMVIPTPVVAQDDLDWEITTGDDVVTGHGTPYPSGNVGIATDYSPDRKLEIVDTSNPQLRLTHTEGSVFTDFQTTSSGHLYINPSGGKVGIGTADPEARLEVKPTITSTADYTGIKSGIIYDGASPMINWYGTYIATPSGTGSILSKYALVTEANAGNVGIGTTSPQQKLTLGSGSNFATEMPAPGKPSATVYLSGGMIEDGTYYYVITALDGFGQTVKGIESDAVKVLGGSGYASVELTWTAVTGAVSYKVYRTTTPGDYSSPAYIGASVTNEYTDVKKDPSNGEPPSSTTAYVNKITSSGNSWFLGGKIGIGTNNPGVTLHVMSGVEEHIRVQKKGQNPYMDITSGGAWCGLELHNTLVELFSIWEGDWDTGQNRFHIRNGGNIGIGTMTPDKKLEIQDDTDAQLRLSNADAFYTDLQTTSSGHLYINPSGGRVGIGEASPGSELDVAGTITGDGLVIDGTVSGTGFNGWDRDDSDDLTTSTGFDGDVSGIYNDLQLRPEVVGSAELASSGVTAGTYGSATQVAQITVDGDGRITSAVNVNIDISGSETDPQVDDSQTTNYVPKWDGSALVTGTMYDNGNIGIGTTLPGAKLDVRPGQSEKGIRIRAHGLPEDNLLRIEDGSGQHRWRVDQLFDMYFTTMGGEDVVRIAENGIIYFDNGGNVGIGTKSATSRLTVSGDAKISDSLNVDSGTLYVDNVNDRVGIGDTSPGAHLVVGSDANMGIADGIGDAYIQNDLEVDGNIYMGNNLVATQAWVLSQGYGNGDITAVGSMTSGAAFADSTADDDWLGLGSSAGRIEFDDQTTDEVNILNAKVGIGTTSPDTKLEIIDSSGPQLRLTHTDGSYYTDFQTNLEGHLWIDPSGDVLNVGDTNTLYVNTNLDRVGISESSPYCTLGVDGNVAIGDGYANFPGPANGAIIEGDVGIGTWSPLADLHISDGGVLGFTPRDDNPSDDEGVCKLYIVEYNNPPFYTYRTYVLYLMSPQGTTEEVARVTDYF